MMTCGWLSRAVQKRIKSCARRKMGDRTRVFPESQGAQSPQKYWDTKIKGGGSEVKRERTERKWWESEREAREGGLDRVRKIER